MLQLVVAQALVERVFADKETALDVIYHPLLLFLPSEAGDPLSKLIVKVNQFIVYVGQRLRGPGEQPEQGFDGGVRFQLVLVASADQHAQLALLEPKSLSRV